MNKSFKKFFVSGVVVVASALYVLTQHPNSGQSFVIPPTDTSVAVPSSSPDQTPINLPKNDEGRESDNTSAVVSSNSPGPVINPKPSPVASLPSATPSPIPVQQGVYRNGTYTGNVADAYYGNVQVAVLIKNEKIADVNFLQYPNDRNHSVQINNYAMPLLTSEAIQAQSANVDTISGATATSAAFIESLAFALAQAKA